MKRILIYRMEFQKVALSNRVGLKFLTYAVGQGLIYVLIILCLLCPYAIASVDSSYIKTAIASRIDLRRYFEKAMALFENGEYKEAIMVFEKIIEIETAQDEDYFTPFAEIYIDKSKERMAEMLVLEEKKWEKMKKEVVNEAERIAKEEEEKIVREEQARRMKEGWSQKKEEYESERELKDIYIQAIKYYKQRNYPLAIIEFKKVKEIAPESPLAAHADAYISQLQKELKHKEQKALLVKMEEARRGKIEMEKDQRQKEIQRQKKEMEKQVIKRIFECRLRVKEFKERVSKVSNFMDTIIGYVSERRFDEAELTVNKAIAEFPEHKRFKEILHYVQMQKIKMDENALKRARELTEEKMLLDVAKKHILPEKKEGVLEKEKKITPVVRVPEIRKRLKIPISVDFKDVELDYVLSFLSDATGVNIVPSSEIDMTEKKVSIKIKDMPLEEALRYILKSQDLVYRIEEDAVWVLTKEELDNEKVETRVYFLNQGIGRFAEFTTTASTSGGEKEQGESKTTTSSEVKTIKDILEKTVDWPKDSKLTMDDRTGALIISNIPSNLETIENLLYNLDVTPMQVLIEARFLEVKVTDIDDLGIEWKLNSPWGVQQNNRKQNEHGFASNSGVDFSNFSRSDEGFNLTYQGILSHPQFQAVMHALQEKKNVKTLSAPRITTLNNQTATIEVIDEYIYPTRYEVSLVQYDINGDGDFDDAGETEWANIPQDFVTRDVGILLHVKPSVGVDKKTITLALTPEVSEDAGSYTYSGSVTIPKFTTRNLSTSVIVNNGDTVVMGGLIKETKTDVKTKVPVLGDIPLLGGLFRKRTDETERRNLLIFVTASVLEKEEVLASNVEQDEMGKKQ